MSYIGKTPSEQGSRGEYIGTEPSVSITPPVVNPFTGDIPINVLVLSTFNITASATRWAVGYGHTTLGTAESQYVVPEDCTIDFLSANINANPGSTIIYTLRKNGIDTAKTVTLSPGVQKATDTANSVHFRRGDSFSVRLVSGVLGVSTIDGTVALGFVRYGTNQGLPCLWMRQDATAGGSFSSGLDMSATGVTLAMAQIPYPATSIMVDTVRDAATGVVGSALYKNGVIVPSTNGFGGLPNPEARQAAPFDLAAGDTFACSGQETTVPHVMHGGRMVTQPLGSTLYPKAHFFFSSNPMATNTTRFMGTYGRKDNLPTPNGSLVESEMQFIPPPCKIRELYAYIDILPPAGQTVTLFLRKNGANTALTAQFVNGGTQVISDLANEVSFNGTTDLATIATVGTATSGTRYVNGSMQIYRP